jgi:dihydroorotate dehydrogenase
VVAGAEAPDPRLSQKLLGLTFPNPLGLAAGFDKNAEAVAGALGLGFGFVETGTVTPRPQQGNPRPRIFRLTADRAIVNRLGFNNDGFEAAARRLAAPRRGIAGVNIGANRDSTDRIADYVSGVGRFAPLADYLTINISSPNTPGLRDLQGETSLRALLGAVAEARSAAPRRVPILVKLAPDLEDAALPGIAAAIAETGMDGVIVSNTTIERDGLRDARAAEAGGLSGPPLFRRSTAMLAKLRKLIGQDAVIVGVGGVDSAEAAWAKLAAGANLVQFYTGLVYEGPGLVRRILRGLSERIDREGLATIGDVVGSDAARPAKGG